MTSTNDSASSADGTGLVGTVVGGFVFLTFLFFAAQVMLGLYATSVVTAVAYDAAKAVAGADAGGTTEARRSAEAAARRALGRLGDDAELSWGREGDDVVLRVRARRPSVLGDVVRTVRVRLEAVR
ncbi:MAG TPA: hypothetical protein VHF47_00315 [Acidimicrobiales bacterium]|nr:hypothetical protein [Acidimicrobiales bacterium]